MGVKNYLEKSSKLKSLFEEIYTSNSNVNLLSKITEFIETIVKLTDKGEIDKVDSGYIITDVLLKYDSEDFYENVFDIAAELEIAEAKVYNWSKEEIDVAWNELKLEFFSKSTIISNT